MYFKQIVFILIVSSSLSGGTTGKLTGVVKDEESGNSLIGCNIIINGTLLGASSNEKGDYYILNIPPGKYSLNITMIGYSNYIVNDFEVNSDLTTEFKIPMKVSSIQGSEVVVNAKQNLINKNLTSTTAIITSDNIDKLPVTEVSEIMNVKQLCP